MATDKSNKAVLVVVIILIAAIAGLAIVQQMTGLFAIKTVNTVNLTVQTCAAENRTTTKGSFPFPCDGTYPAACGSLSSNDRLSCNDGFTELHQYHDGSAPFGYAGVKVTAFNSSITDCASINTVEVCYEWWTVTASDPADCDISVDNDGGVSFTAVTTICPGSTANPGVTCVDVTSNETDWVCGNFFGASGTRAQIKSELRRSVGADAAAKDAFWDVLFFRVTYTTTAVCGNGVVESGEACDDGNTVSGDGCSNVCVVEFCGDGITQAGLGEACDDGANGDDTDLCTDSCTLTFCGDGTIQDPNGDGEGGTTGVGDEECDSGEDNGVACGPPGYDDSCTYCDFDCTNVTLTGPFCGDSERNLPFEDCDGSDLGGASCSTVNTFTGGNLSCGFGCEYDTSACFTCGDGTLEAGEECDDGGICSNTAAFCTSDLDCFDGEDFGTCSPTGEDGCSASCEVEPGFVCFENPEPPPDSVCEATCGNGDIDEGEECDDANTANFDGCSDTCFVEEGWTCDNSDPPSDCTTICGDGIVAGIEECDDGESNGACPATCSAECTTNFCPSPPPPPPPSGGGRGGDGTSRFCGDGFCGHGETTETCPKDCGCPPGEVLYNNACRPLTPGLGDGFVCGDGIRNTILEECDDGNLLDGDGCNSLCQREEVVEEAFCGDGFLDENEECDDGNSVGGDGCSQFCTVEVAPAPPAAPTALFFAGPGAIFGWLILLIAAIIIWFLARGKPLPKLHKHEGLAHGKKKKFGGEGHKMGKGKHSHEQLAHGERVKK